MLNSASEFGIAAGFQNFHSSNIAYANMIGQGDVFGHTDRLGEGVAGKGMALAASSGKTLFTGAASMMGFDPISMGASSAMRAWQGGSSILGAGAAGIGMASGVAAVGAVGNFAVGQMYQGAQQQQQLNQTLRGFNFTNPQGGQGFNSQQGGQIGSFMRGMSHDVGALGQMTNMGELTKLAGNMSRMGIDQNVRSVEEFKTKFKQMIEATKKIATDLGTTLEEAQKAMVSMKNSGVFNRADQMKMSGQFRAGAQAGNLAMSEISGMASIGSQISRSVGGLGRSGAFGGALAMTQVGTALQTGAISEEDIYNATGQTGAEGRQAFATNMMSRSANFLSGGRGRRFLASVAGKNGQLDEASVQEWMTSGMGTGRTMQRAHENLSGVGRANFIRNEGRLRGAALEKFGGMAQTMAYASWLGERGFNPDQMDDRSMLAFQRFSGQGRDEADASIKMVQGLPDMLQRMRESKSETASLDRLAGQRSNSGLNLAKRKLEQAKHAVTDKLQQTGADLLSEGSDMVSRFINTLADRYETRASDDIASVMRSMRSGGQRGVDAYKRTLAGPDDNMKKFLALNGGGLPHEVTRSKGETDRASYLGNQMDRLKGAGAMTGEEAAFMGNAANAGAFRDFYANNMVGKSVEERKKQMSAFLGGAKGKEAEALRAQFEKDPNKALASIHRMEEAGGISRSVGVGAQLQGEAGELRGRTDKEGAFRTGVGGEADQALGKSLLGNRSWDSVESDSKFEAAARSLSHGIGYVAAGTAGLGGALGGGLAGFFANQAEEGGSADEGMGAYLKRKLDPKNVARRLMSAGREARLGATGADVRDVGEGVSDFLTGDSRRAKAVGAWSASEEGTELLGGLLAGRKDAQLSAQNKMMELRNKGDHLDQAGKDQLAAIENGVIGAMMISGGKTIDQMSDAEKKAMVAKVKTATGKDVSIEDIQNKAAGLAGNREILRRENVRESALRASEAIKLDAEDLTKSGVAKMDDNGKLVLTQQGMGKDNALGVNSQDAMDIGLKIANTKIEGTTAEKEATLSELYGEGGLHSQLASKISGMSSAEKKAFATNAAGTSMGGMAAESYQRERRLGSLITSGKNQGMKGAEAYGVGTALGVDVSKEDAADMSKMSTDQQAMLLLKKQGLSGQEEGSETYRAAVKKSLELAKAGKTGEAADVLDDAKKGLGTEAKKKIEEKQSAKQEADNPMLGPMRKTAENTANAVTAIKQMMTVLAAGDDKMAAALAKIKTAEDPPKP